MNKLSREELRKRAKCIRLVLTDNDGVLTDTGVYYSDKGEEFKRFSIRDGMGVERLRKVGVQTVIITGENSGSVKKRAEKLQLPFLYLGIKDKLAQLETILRETGYKPHELAYIGDDSNDLKIITEINKEGITACPSDAMEFVQEVVHYICTKPGGNGAFRDFAEMIISLKKEESEGE
ncbi:3-deoxy-D-manno-octulosonate 8-phosphate phosphatase, YrbI family [Chloroherpeton thalassium ATCC 35110]|uniref:3-deoxy-D-manno-octulosonate 8-phosphate phosphatase, YrbI family n=1 Tax=Chloroherpeton thalassium (strain ATCC 35110 / GB-78) TaxID=517418 RepID=B3QY58_CHLT3|nr:HAD-IIIA family hydrolase [Chloroherpeton thalassium]ACF15024.1 3-deoxy-D-manno-octulosonate 8-phosphate phosphatase, YrbI family [Chloroherpeton thalassium ATCC 35110]